MTFAEEDPTPEDVDDQPAEFREDVTAKGSTFERLVRWLFGPR